MVRNTRTDDDAGKYCTSCRKFYTHCVPVQCSPSKTGKSGCPDCYQADTFKYVVHNMSDERSITNGYIPRNDPSSKIPLDVALREVC